MVQSVMRTTENIMKKMWQKPHQTLIDGRSVMFVLISSLGLNAWAIAPAPPGLQGEVYRAIEDYFVSSQRRVESIQVGGLTRLAGDEYIAQADASAQEAFGPRIIPYHCGVFLTRIVKAGKVTWDLTAVTCEPNPRYFDW